MGKSPKGRAAATARHATPAVPGRFDALPDIIRHQPDRETYLAFYRMMLLIRRFEEKAGQLYGMGLIGGFCHLYIGQEAVVTGLQAAISPGRDFVITGYRDHGHMLACGIPAKVVMAELTGRAAGISKGKGGSMHMFSVEHGFFGGHGIVGAQVPIGAGLAFAQKYRQDVLGGEGGVTLAYFGDGAANQGQVYEAFNMAELWKLPVVFVIENNQYAMGTSVNRASSEDQLYRRGESFRIEGVQVDGMDVLAVRGAATLAIDWAKTRGPILLEMKTYRYRGHSMSDPAKYRTRDEVSAVREQQDPIDHAAREIVALGLATEAELKAVDKDVRAEVAEAADFAEQTPEPELAELFTDVLVERY